MKYKKAAEYTRKKTSWNQISKPEKKSKNSLYYV